MNNILIIPKYQRTKPLPKPIKDLELLPLNNGFAQLTKNIKGDDDLRPIMSGNYFDLENGKIATTDAHILTSINMPSYTKSFIKQNYKTKFICKTIKDLKKEYSSLIKIGNAKISFEEFTQTNEVIDGNYPNYMAVIPHRSDNDNALLNVDYEKLYWYAKVLLDAKIIPNEDYKQEKEGEKYQTGIIDYLKDAYFRFINPTTNFIILKYTNTKENKVEYIGVNAKYLINMMIFAKQFKNKSNGLFFISKPNRAILVELDSGLLKYSDSVGLVMPVMVNNLVIGNVDFDTTYSMFYDLDNNTILSDGENYEIDESIGFIGSNIKKQIIKKEAVNKPKKQEVLKENKKSSVLLKRIENLKFLLDLSPKDPVLIKRINALELLIELN